MVPFSELIEILDDPQSAHAAMVHFPVVLSIAAAVLALVSAAALGRVRWLRWMVFLTAGVTSAAIFFTVNSGEAAEDEMGDPPAVAREQAHEHEELAEQALLWSYGAFGLTLLVWLPGKPLRAIGAVAALGGTGALSWAVASTAHHGGELVYHYGVGTPKPVTTADLSPAPLDPAAGDPRLAWYEREVRPILSKYCFSCHGSDTDLEGDLSLTTAGSFLQGGETGPALIPGDAEGSLLYQAVAGLHPDLFMPPSKTGLTQDQIQTLRRWIEDGAVWAPEQTE